MQQLKRLARYLRGTSGYAVALPKAGSCETLLCYSDADQSGCKVTRRSVSSGVLELGGATLFAYSRTQKVVSLSSGESEYYAAVDCACEAIFFRKVLAFLGFQCIARLLLDSAAAIGISRRQGVGRIRHLSSKTLWLQQAVLKGVVELEKVDGRVNKADLGTKCHPGPRLRQLTMMLGYLGVSDPNPRTVSAIGPPSFSPDLVQKLVWLAAVFDAIGRVTAQNLDVQVRPRGGLSITRLSHDEAGFWWVRSDLVQLLLLAAVAVGLFMGALFFYLAGSAARVFAPRLLDTGPRSSEADTSPKEQLRFRHVRVQSQCSYTWWRHQGRFRPLMDREHGCWPE